MGVVIHTCESNMQVPIRCITVGILGYRVRACFKQTEKINKKAKYAHRFIQAHFSFFLFFGDKVSLCNSSHTHTGLTY